MGFHLPYLNDADDWSVVVPVIGEPDLTGSTLFATINPILGGMASDQPVAEISTENAAEDGKITIQNNTAGKAIALIVDVPIAARNGWRADRRQVDLAFDVHRTVSPSLRREGLGRVRMPVYPDSGSPLLYRLNPSQEPLLIPVQPKPAYLAEPLQLGPQGPPGPGTEQLAALEARVAALEAAADP